MPVSVDSVAMMAAVRATEISSTSLTVCAICTTSECVLSTTEMPLTVSMMSPTSRPDDSAGVSGSMADMTTGWEP